MTNPQPINTLTLQDAWTEWLKTPRKGHPGQTNADRGATDRANHKRALMDFAVGVNGEEDLSLVSLKLYAVETDRVLENVTLGARQRCGSSLTTRKLTMLHSWSRRLREDLGPFLSLPEVAPLSGRRMRNLMPKKTYLPPFFRSQWPEGLAKEYEALKGAYTDAFYAGPGHEYFNSHTVRPTSLEGYQSALNQYVRFCLQEEQLSAPTLDDLVDQARVMRYRAWYLQQVAQGGYRRFDMTCQALSNIYRYLVATGQRASGHRPDSRADDAPWMTFHRLASATLDAGMERNAVVQLEEIPFLRDTELRQLAQLARRTKPRTTGRRRPTTYNVYIRERTATIFFLESVVPLRLLNVRSLRWGQNLYEIRPGVWHIHLRPHEIKNGKKGRNKKRRKQYRSIQIDLPKKASAWVVWWRERLESYLGERFEEKSPYVFPMRALKKNPDGTFNWVQSSETSIQTSVDALCLELRNHRFRMHRFRHCVATSIISDGGSRVVDMQQAATVLGDSLDTVLKKYNRPDEQKLLNEGYFSRIDDEAPE